MPSSTTTEKFNIVILYDHVRSVGRAMEAWSHLTQELENEFLPELRIWRIDIAISPEYAAQAQDDIKAAQMVIMAVRGGQPCPAAFLHWIAGAEEDGGLPNRALVVIMEAVDRSDLSRGTWTSTLRVTVAQTQLDVFFWEPLDDTISAPSPACSPETLPEPNVSLPTLSNGPHAGTQHGEQVEDLRQDYAPY